MKFIIGNTAFYSHSPDKGSALDDWGAKKYLEPALCGDSGNGEREWFVVWYGPKKWGLLPYDFLVDQKEIDKLKEQTYPSAKVAVVSARLDGYAPYKD